MAKTFEIAYPGKPTVEANVQVFILFCFYLLTLDLIVKAKIVKAEIVLWMGWHV